MSGIGVVWGMVKTAATKIPWGRVLQNAPAVVDLIGRAKESLQVPHSDLEERLGLIQEQNLKLEQTLLQTAEHLQELTKTLEVMAARQRLLSIGIVVSLLIAVSSLSLWFVR
jgi:hypothetical protein